MNEEVMEVKKEEKEEKLNMKQKLGIIQAELSVPKKQYNSYSEFYYRSCEDIMEAVKPYLQKLGLSLIMTDDVVQVGERYYIRATATLVDLESQQTIKTHALAREQETKKGMDASQITGAASTYARKYCLNGLFAIDDVRDADTMPKDVIDEKIQKAEKIKDTKISDGQCKSLTEALINRGENSVDKFKEYFGVENLSDLTKEQYAMAVEMMNAKPVKRLEL